MRGDRFLLPHPLPLRRLCTPPRPCTHRGTARTTGGIAPQMRPAPRVQRRSPMALHRQGLRRRPRRRTPHPGGGLRLWLRLASACALPGRHAPAHWHTTARMAQRQWRTASRRYRTKSSCWHRTAFPSRPRTSSHRRAATPALQQLDAPASGFPTACHEVTPATLPPTRGRVASERPGCEGPGEGEGL